jgi:hypothetical protein
MLKNLFIRQDCIDIHVNVFFTIVNSHEGLVALTKRCNVSQEKLFHHICLKDC